MKHTTAASVFAMSWAGAAAALDYNAPPPDLSTLPNLTLFETWRPKIHILPPNGQVGDPCAHYNDPETGLFHVGYLHNSSGIATVLTDDLVHYYDVNKNGNYSITPGGSNDPVSVFDGSVVPNGIDGKPTLLYTSVSSLPIHWTLPYTRGSESQSLAVTSDGGKNFTKLDVPPVIPEPPVGLDVTAFRDPYVFQNGELDRALNSAKGTWYVTVSGGVHNVGPGIFLYRNQSSDFKKWEYIGEWFSAPSNSTWGNGDWARFYGFNWETANVFSLDRQGYNFSGDAFMTFGVESSYMPIQKSVSSLHAMLWAAGNISTAGGNVTFNPNMIGVLDWGLSAYAAAGKVLPSTSKASSSSGAPDRFVSFVWLTGDLFEAVRDYPTAQQGWQSTLLLPRELSLQSIPNVVNNALVHETASWRVAGNAKGSCVELEALGINIVRETYDAMTAAPSFSEPNHSLSNAGTVPFNRSPESKFFVLNAQISFPQSARGSNTKSGFQILSSELESTTIYYQFSNESIVIDRYNTSAASQTTSGIVSSPESGRLRLFDINDSCNGSGKAKDNKHMETLDLTFVVDNSVLEVYANSRFALSTWAR